MSLQDGVANGVAHSVANGGSNGKASAGATATALVGPCVKIVRTHGQYVNRSVFEDALKHRGLLLRAVRQLTLNWKNTWQVRKKECEQFSFILFRLFLYYIFSLFHFQLRFFSPKDA